MARRGKGNEQDELQRARKVLQTIMRHRHSKTLFNQPVDPEKLGLPDYFEIVQKPQDFGSILASLNGSLEKGSNISDYRTAAEVCGEILLVFNNCKRYNRREQDSVTRQAAEEVQAIFEEKWAAAGLEGLHKTSPSASEGSAVKPSPSGSVDTTTDEAPVLQFSLQGARLEQATPVQPRPAGRLRNILLY